MTYSTLLTERTGPVLKITTNRPDVLNAQSRILLEELDDAFAAGVKDSDVRVIILAGAGKHFSAGHDLGSPQEMEDQKKTPLEPGFKGEYRRLWERFFENTMRWRDLPKPTIAQVQGYCIMGGMMIASACDIIIASEDAQFADRAVKWGGSHVQYFSMPWDFGPRKTKEYLFTGDFISAADAEKAGLVNRVVPREKLQAETMALAQRIAERDPYALKLAKASVNETQDAQGWRQAMENAFKNYMLTIPHRIEMGTYGPAARGSDEIRIHVPCLGEQAYREAYAGVAVIRRVATVPGGIWTGINNIGNAMLAALQLANAQGAHAPFLTNAKKGYIQT